MRPPSCYPRYHSNTVPLPGPPSAAILFASVALATASLSPSGLPACLKTPPRARRLPASVAPPGRVAAMAAGRSSLEELELTGEEAERLAKAFQDEGFRKLFAEYAAELADPAQRAIYEAEVAELERQRGVEARFLHPKPGWVLRTSQGGTRRCYLNVCSNPLVGRPEARREPGGSCWSLPHCLAPGREELSRRRPRGPRRLVYDVLFHPDTLRLAARSARFRRLVDETALEAVEKRFAPGLDRANAAPLRGTQYKGLPQASLLRTPLPGGPPPPPPAGDGEGDTPLPPFPTPYAYPPPEPERETRAPQPSPSPPPAPAPAATTPRWTLRHRSYVDLQDYRHSRDSAPSPVPRELVVTIELPLLGSAAQAQLEVRGRELQLDSPRPAAYHLRLPLPYPVDEASGTATFNKAKRQLVVTLPVAAKPGPGPFSGCGQDSPQEPSSAASEEEEDDKARSPGSGSPEGTQEASAPIPAPDSARLPPEPAKIDQERLPATHVGASSMVLPECPIEKDPVSPTAPASPDPTTEGSDLRPIHASSAKSPGLPTCADEVGSPLPGAAESRAEVSLPEPPKSATAGANVDLGVGRACAELPGSPGRRGSSITSPGAPAGQPHPPDTGMDRHQCSDVDPLPSPPHRAPCCNLSAEAPGTPLARCDCSGVDQGTELSPSAGSPGPPPCPQPTSLQPEMVAPALCPGKGTSASASPPPLPSTGTEAPVPCPGSLVCPASPPPLLCPPLDCMQDEQVLTLLLQVPGVVPQSLKGEVGTNHYRVSFDNEDSASYRILLQFLPENKLTPPESKVSVSPNNIVIVLAKSPETTGLWTKFCCGPNANMLQERWFVTENNVDKFLSNLPPTSCSSLSEMEEQPLIEVLDISEGKSQIRLKQAQEPDKTESRRERDEYKGSKLSTDAEKCLVQSKRVSGSLAAVETMGQVGKGPSHCSVLDLCHPSSAIPQESHRHDFHDSEPAFPTSERATSPTPTHLIVEQPTQTGEEKEVYLEATQNKQGRDGRPAPPVIKETNMQDGSVQYISQHATHCAVTFQNVLLYELD